MVSLTNLRQSSSLTTSAAMIMTWLAPNCLALSLMPLSLVSLLATNTRFAPLFAYSYAICCDANTHIHTSLDRSSNNMKRERERDWPRRYQKKRRWWWRLCPPCFLGGRKCKATRRRLRSKEPAMHTPSSPCSPVEPPSSAPCSTNPLFRSNGEREREKETTLYLPAMF